eukprot:1874158-Rhodomonas_salina.1
MSAAQGSHAPARHARSVRRSERLVHRDRDKRQRRERESETCRHKETHPTRHRERERERASSRQHTDSDNIATTTATPRPRSPTQRGEARTSLGDEAAVVEGNLLGVSDPDRLLPPQNTRHRPRQHPPPHGARELARTHRGRQVCVRGQHHIQQTAGDRP